eukprot:1157936-Pelagomonas_calceolata.AAC.2
MRSIGGHESVRNRSLATGQQKENKSREKGQRRGQADYYAPVGRVVEMKSSYLKQEFDQVPA